MPKPEHVVVIGGGPAGLTAAWELVRHGVRVTVLEKAKTAGGLGGTTVFEGRDGTYRFDYGGHRFITHNPDLLRLVEELLGDELLIAHRKSVIRLGGRTYRYPLELGDLLRTAPPSLLAGAVRDLLTLPRGKAPMPDDFASWITSRFGPTLYRAFFEGYTEKLWGIPPTQLSADWADQRISLLDLKDVARRLLPGASGTVRTYARAYRYPKYGFGLLFERLAEKVTADGATVRFDSAVTGFITQDDGRVTAVETTSGTVPCDAVISTLPLPDAVRLTGGESALRFRGLRFLNMPMAMENVSDCTWQYLSDPHIMATRLQEPRRRSPYMAPEGRTSLMLEIPCDPGDALWDMPEADLFARAQDDVAALGVDTSKATGEFFTVRTPHAYPLMDVDYRARREAAIAHLAPLRNLIQCGRQGTFRYVFTDTAMEMGQMAAQSLVTGEDRRRLIYDHRNERTVIETQSIA